MACHLAQAPAGGDVTAGVLHQRLDQLETVAPRRGCPEEERIDLRQQPGFVVGRAPEHHPVDVLQLRMGLARRVQAAVEHDAQIGEIALERMREFVAQRRNLPVLLRTQPREPGVSGVHDERPRASLGDGTDEIAHETVVLDPVDADPVLDGYRNRHGVAHRAHAVAHERGLGHQAGAEGAALHALARAAAVQVDLVVAPALAQARAVRQVAGLAAAELQRHRVLGRIEVQVTRLVPVQQGSCGDHLGVEQRTARQQPMEEAAVTVGPVEHRRDAEAVRRELRRCGLQGLRIIHSADFTS